MKINRSWMLYRSFKKIKLYYWWIWRKWGEGIVCVCGGGGGGGGGAFHHKQVWSLLKKNRVEDGFAFHQYKLLVLYFLQFYLTCLRGKEYFTKLDQWSGAGAAFFWPLGAGTAWKKSKEPKPNPEPLKNYPAPQPCSFLALIWRKNSPNAMGGLNLVR